jgi:transaldolase
MRSFFFDTANIPFIEDTMEKYGSQIDPKWVRGITTNPNAFSKVNMYHLDEWFAHTAKMAKLISEIRGDNDGEIHIQAPYSYLEPEVILEYAKMISDLTEGNCKVGMKIPPYQNVLEYVDRYNEYVITNVTGLADSSTALKCITYDVGYVSIIPGRMEEVGIDAKSAIAFVNQCNFGNTQIITGSQRTTEQIIYSFYLDTVPTIGEKCWSDIFQGDNFQRILDIEYGYESVGPFSPTISQDNINLSLAFFEQMDGLGDIAKQDLEKKLSV